MRAAYPVGPYSGPLSRSAQATVDNLEAQAKAIQSEIDRLDQELERYTENYNQLQVKLDETNVRLLELRRDLDQAEKDHAYQVRKWERHLCALYKSGGRSRFFQLVLEAQGFTDLVYRIRLGMMLAEEDERALESVQRSTDRLEELVQEVDKVKQEQVELRTQIEAKRREIQTALAARETVLNQLNDEIRQIIEQERKRQEEEQARLRTTLAAIVSGARVTLSGSPQSEIDIVTQLLETAAAYLGTPYVWAGDRPSTGFDCSGFTAYVYAQHGVYLPHYSGSQAQMGTPVQPQDIRPGDLLAFGWPVYHVGIYIGEGLFIHAPRTGDVVRISRLSERSDLALIRRFDLKPRVGPPAFW
ncbi:MAG: NlpC/P60 family protein [Thermoleophilia bacterium]|nr:NlpC/P60 family protein [Thermoleophilia bacterium]